MNIKDNNIGMPIGYQQQQSLKPQYNGGGSGGMDPTMAISGANALTNVAGTAMSIYGAYKAQKMAEREARDRRRQQALENEFRERQYADNMQQQGFNNNLTIGNYATDYRKTNDDIYGAYNAKNRL